VSRLKSQTTEKPPVTPCNHSSFDHIINDLESHPTVFLQVVSGEHIGRIVPLSRSMTRLGLSDTACAIVVNRGREGCFLSHLEGEKQPMVDGMPTGTSSIRLFEGALVEIEGIRLKFHQETTKAADNMV
jgi:hypothetical protein